jgi:DNA-directed RNA polymerase subunit beta'
MSNPTCTADRDTVRIGLASPEQIRGWSCGEVTRAETINYRTFRPEKDGLFCERIFGPQKDWECACGRLRGMKYRGNTCAHCGVTVTHSRSRRQRMGHIELAAPVVHAWFFRGRPNPLATLLGLKPAELESVIYYEKYLVLDPGRSKLAAGQVIDEATWDRTRERYRGFEADTGAEAIQSLLERLDLEAQAEFLRSQLAALGGSLKEEQRRLQRWLRLVDALGHSGNRPEWMVLRCLPVIPPDLRPIVMLEPGQMATSDLNDLYRRVIGRNNRLKKLLALHSPEVILRNEKRMLQQAVDALFDNQRCKRPVLGSSGQPLKSLGEMLGGKQGRFRQNLLGKRVDYSARSVIVAGPELKLHQCGLPKKIALELFQPFVIRCLKERGLATTIRAAKRMIERREECVWDALVEAVKDHPVLLNRAPTLHRLGIQAFEPVLIEGNAIRLHPLVCKGFNADFDGDQMAVHLPLSIEAQVEAKVLMMPTHNIFSPANGQPIISPSQDIVVGCGYLTWAEDDKVTRWQGDKVKAQGRAMPTFASTTEVLVAEAQRKVNLHERIRVRLSGNRPVVCEDSAHLVTRSPCHLVTTTVGRVLFNDILDPRMPFYDLSLTASSLRRVIADCHRLLGRGETVALLDRMKALGFRAATRSGVSFALDDLRTTGGKEEVVHRTEKAVAALEQSCSRGLISADEREERVISLWMDARDEIGRQVMDDLAKDRRTGPNPLYLMAASGARGNQEQLRQLAGMRGLMVRPSGQVVSRPITSSLREGLSVPEYWSSTTGARKGLTDTALKTAGAGYLTRKLIDVAQNVVVNMHDCGTKRGIETELLRGRFLVSGKEPLTEEEAARLKGREGVRVRSPLTCAAPSGVCQLCYGIDLSTGKLVEEGTAVGIVAAQSIGEPGTQLTMRTFHIGGVHSDQDITLGLPRVTELFEAQRPRNAAVLAEAAGEVRVGGAEDVRHRKQRVFVQPLDEHGKAVGPERPQSIPEGRRLLITEGQQVAMGEALTDGTPDPHDVLRLRGREAVQRYLVNEVQAVYRAQGVELDDRHIEVIVARMLLPGSTQVLGVTRAAVRAQSFIAAAAFQETATVLTEAALAGKVDPLAGVKENVALGRLIPAGTGFRRT